MKFVCCRLGKDLVPECTTAIMMHSVSVMVWGSMTITVVIRVVSVLRKRAGCENICFKTIPRTAFFNRMKVHATLLEVARTGLVTIMLLFCLGLETVLTLENLWSMLQVLMSRYSTSSNRELIKAVIHAWYKVITPENLRCLVHSMPRRI